VGFDAVGGEKEKMKGFVRRPIGISVGRRDFCSSIIWVKKNLSIMGMGKTGKVDKVRDPKTMKIMSNLLCRATYDTMNAEYCKNLEWGPFGDHKTDGGPRYQKKLTVATACFDMRRNDHKQRTDLLCTWTWGKESYFGSVDPSLRHFIGGERLRRLYLGLRVWCKLP